MKIETKLVNGFGTHLSLLDWALIPGLGSGDVVILFFSPHPPSKNLKVGVTAPLTLFFKGIGKRFPS